MLGRLVRRIRALWAFILAASAAPITYLLSMPCGFACTSCPLGGACLIAFPFLFVTIVLLKSLKKIKSAIVSVKNKIDRNKRMAKV